MNSVMFYGCCPNVVECDGLIIRYGSSPIGCTICDYTATEEVAVKQALTWGEVDAAMDHAKEMVG